MRVVVTGASGNVGTSVLEALGEEPRVKSIAGIARRVPEIEMPKTEWVGADVTEDDLAPIFDGADAVVHLAWAIQPSRDESVTERINVEGSRRVFEAAAAAKVPALVHASSVGAYSPGPKQRQVDESWPVDGIPTSFYSRHKAATEDLLDGIEKRAPEMRVVRLRPALIFKAEAASEIRRLFAGPFLPGFLVRKSLVPLLPRVPRLRFQAVDSRDIGQAYRQAVVRDVSGAFNIAAEPEIGIDELCELFGARSFPLPAGALRAAADLSWKLRLQPSPPGWIDLALGVPMMDTSRAREELGWEPTISSLDALDDLLKG
ncbi:MAG TPA: NAD-dependent epimerase/dehydratase family protein, partial [Solirubrobacterales bacterium]|nr:NAD-dependent epimerase/dehydratase family protein [Solirubrobacterales bacterium]